MTPAETPEWKQIARNKRADQQQLIPKEWRLPSMEHLPKNALAYIRESSILTPEELSITEITDARHLLNKIATGGLTAVQVLRAFCKRAAIAQQLVGCCTELMFDEALERAVLLDNHLATTGRVIGPLHGLPISFKDNIDVKGYDTTWGWVGLIDKPAPADCVTVEVLKSLGAVPFVKTNVPQTIMMSDSYNHVFKQTLHSWNRELVSGGSSGGESSLIGGRGSILGIGTDTGGSIRIPSIVQGLYGLCPSVGRIAFDDSGNRRYIAPPVSGPMASSLATIETFMEAYLGAEPWKKDPTTVPLPWNNTLAQVPSRPLRIAYYTDDGVVLPQPPIRRAVETVAQKLKEAGHHVTIWDSSNHGQLMDYWTKTTLADGGSLAKSYCDMSGEPLIQGLIVGSESDRLSIAEMEQMAELRIKTQKEYLRRWNDSEIDALITPALTFTGLRPREWVQSHAWVGYTAVWNWLGFASLAVPVTTIDADNSAPDTEWAAHVPRNPSDQYSWEHYDPELASGMPVGVLVVGGRFGEEKTISVAKAIDKALGR